MTAADLRRECPTFVSWFYQLGAPYLYRYLSLDPEEQDEILTHTKSRFLEGLKDSAQKAVIARSEKLWENDILLWACNVLKARKDSYDMTSTQIVLIRESCKQICEHVQETTNKHT